MKSNPFWLFIFLAFVASFSSCDWLNVDNETEVSSNPYFVSLRFASDAERPGLGSAIFTLEKDEVVGDSVIVNLDSLPFNTNLNKVISTYTFNSVSNTYLYQTDSVRGIDSLHISATTGADTIDYRWEVSVRNIASNKKAEATYRVKVNVHKVQPELYQWNKVVSSIYTHAGSEQKALLFNDSLYFFVGSGLNNTLYKSKEGNEWSLPVVIEDLPDFSTLRSILTFSGKMFYVHQDSLLYSSLNGIKWTKHSFGGENYQIRNLLFELNGKLWGVAYSKTDSEYHFAHSTDGLTWSIMGKTPDNFPVKGYTCHSFSSRTRVPKAIVVGGYSADEKIMKNIWSTKDGTTWIDFSTEKTNLTDLAGASIVSYDDKLLMIGCMQDNGIVAKDWLLESIDEGLSWRVPDTTYTQIRQMSITTVGTTLDTTFVYMEPRYLTSSIANKNKEIVVIGGRNQSTFFTDVWIGKLNKLSFIRQ